MKIDIHVSPTRYVIQLKLNLFEGDEGLSIDNPFPDGKILYIASDTFSLGREFSIDLYEEFSEVLPALQELGIKTLNEVFSRFTIQVIACYKGIRFPEQQYKCTNSQNGIWTLTKI